jgi:uncharacterized surface protein with fasciclin (FAS1) repeats
MKIEKSRGGKQMKKKIASIIFVLLIATLAFGAVFSAFNTPAIAQTAKEVEWGTVSKTDIIMTMKEAGVFDTLLAAIETTGFTDLLKEQNSYTFFAPTDEAFGKLKEGAVEELLKPENRGLLVDLLTHHFVINARILSPWLAGRESVKTFFGEPLRITPKNGTLMVDDATVIKADVTTKNGIIHVIDTVLTVPEVEPICKP